MCSHPTTMTSGCWKAPCWEIYDWLLKHCWKGEIDCENDETEDYFEMETVVVDVAIAVVDDDEVGSDYCGMCATG